MQRYVLRSAKLALVLLLAAADDSSAQASQTSPNEWYTSPFGVGMSHFTMNPDGSQDVVIVQCVNGAWSFALSRSATDVEHPFGGPERLSGWWQVDDEAAHGPISLGMRGRAATMEDEALEMRLRQPVTESIRFRVLLGTREWLFEFGPEGLENSVAVLDARCP